MTPIIRFIGFVCRPIPGREYVEGYIKAYYLPEAQLESWIREHKVHQRFEIYIIIIDFFPNDLREG